MSKRLGCGCSGRLSYADLALWLQLWELSEPDNIPDWDRPTSGSWEPFPALGRFKAHIVSTRKQLPS